MSAARSVSASAGVSLAGAAGVGRGARTIWAFWALSAVAIRVIAPRAIPQTTPLITRAFTLVSPRLQPLQAHDRTAITSWKASRQRTRSPTLRPLHETVNA